MNEVCRSQWPRGLRHELSSPAQTPGSWVQIPLEAWTFVYFCSVFVLSCVGSAALRRTDFPPKESYRLSIWLKNLKHRPRFIVDCSAHRVVAGDAFEKCILLIIYTALFDSCFKMSNPLKPYFQTRVCNINWAWIFLVLEYTYWIL
jgi:hypothetical protein